MILGCPFELALRRVFRPRRAQGYMRPLIDFEQFIESLVEQLPCMQAIVDHTAEAIFNTTVGQLKTEKAIAESVGGLEPDEEDNLMK